MPTNPPTPDPGNAPEGILKPPEPVAVDVPVAPIDFEAVTIETLPDVVAQMIAGTYVPAVAPAPDTLGPGVYSNGVLRATVDASGAIVPLTPETT